MEAAAFDFAPAIPEIFLACAAMGLLMVGVFRTEPEASHLVWPLAVMVLVVALFLLLVDDTDPAVTFGGQFVTDRFAVYLKVLILIGAGLCLMMSPGFMAREGIERFEYPVLALFTTVGMMMMISANSLLALYIGLELHSLPLYVMTAFHRDQTRSTEAGLKYFVLGALASGLLLYGCSLVYGFTGTLSFDRLADALAPAADGQLEVSTGVLIEAPAPSARKACARPSNDRVPVKPYTRVQPYSSRPDASAPSTKYLRPASVERVWSRWNAAIT